MKAVWTLEGSGPRAGDQEETGVEMGNCPLSRWLKSWCIFLKRKETQGSWKMGLGSGVGPHQAEVSGAVLSVYTLPDVFKSAFGSLGTVGAGHAQGL